MIKVENVSFRYGKREPLVLDGVSLELRDGEIGILLGKNGSGKTTLFKTILGIETPQSGSIVFDGEDLLKMNRIERARRIAYVPQHIHFGDLSVYDSVLAGRVSRFGYRAGKDDFETVERILAETGLERLAYRSAENLSGGEKQKVAIARALAQEPRMLIFDEPTGNLDIANEELIVEEAKRVAHERNIAILSSIHDLTRALDFGDRFFFLREGKIVASGGGETVSEQLIKDVFDVNARIVEIDGERVITFARKKEKE